MEAQNLVLPPETTSICPHIFDQKAGSDWVSWVFTVWGYVQAAEWKLVVLRATGRPFLLLACPFYATMTVIQTPLHAQRRYKIWGRLLIICRKAGKWLIKTQDSKPGILFSCYVVSVCINLLTYKSLRDVVDFSSTVNTIPVVWNSYTNAKLLFQASFSHQFRHPHKGGWVQILFNFQCGQLGTIALICFNTVLMSLLHVALSSTQLSLSPELNKI